MDMSVFQKEYLDLLKQLSATKYFGRLAVMHHITKTEYKELGIGDFFRQNRFKYAKAVVPGEYIDVSWEEHPAICGGVTEYITKIRLARQLGIGLEELLFFDDVKQFKYRFLSDDDLAFAMYEPDIRYRSGYDYTPEIWAHKNLIIKKASMLADIALDLIKKEFPVIHEIDFHPAGHVMYMDKIAVKGDSDLLINNCLIDFKTSKDYKLSSTEGAQLFAYAMNKYMRDGKDYDDVYILNARFGILEKLS